jgi:hypothetical protein
MRLYGKSMKNKIANCSGIRTFGVNSGRLTPVACGALALLCLAVTFLSGCAARALRTDYKSYENSYAESSNRQMLLNLARLSEHHPTYFFKMGQITTNYRYQATVGGNGMYSPPGYPAGAGGGGTPAGLYEKDPGFSFVPVNDDSTARQLLQPMPAELFYVLFQQGWRVDQLMRLMVDHIEYRPDPKSDAIHTIRNVASEANLKDYLTFLRISALAYHLQRRGHLIFSADQKFQPVLTGGLTLTGNAAPQAKDIVDAWSKNLIWQQDPNNKDSWQLGQYVTLPKFKLTPGYQPGDKDHPSNVKAYDVEIDMPELANVLSLGPTLQILDSNGLGFGVLENAETKDSAKPGPAVQGSAQLVMRSLIGMMAAAAQEQKTFGALMELAKLDKTQDPIPAVELQPLLTLNWDSADESRLTPVLTRLEYMGKTYLIADPQADNPLRASSWNRDNFRILTQLGNLITVDIKNFPPQQILQLRTQ